MKEKSFKPQLCPNDEIDIYTLKYPLLISTKMDGIRCIFYKGQILSRSLKQIQNKQLRERFEKIRKHSEMCDFILDGEIYSHELSFQEITHFVMTQDLKNEHIPESLKFYCFDYLIPEENTISFKDRIDYLFDISVEFKDTMIPVKHVVVNNAQEVELYFEEVLKDNYEGLIIRNPDSLYKFGRCTVRENNAYKLKPWKTEDAKIIGFVQATEVNEDVEKTTTELGMSRTSKRQEDRHSIERASGFVVDFNGKELTVPIAMTDAQKEYIWLHQEEYLNKFIEFRYMTVGMKDLPRIPKFIRMREDKE